MGKKMKFKKLIIYCLISLSFQVNAKNKIELEIVSKRLTKHLKAMDKYEYDLDAKEIYSLNQFIERFNLAKDKAIKYTKIKTPLIKSKIIKVKLNKNQERNVEAKLTQRFLRFATSNDLEWYYNVEKNNIIWRGISTRPLRGCYAVYLTIKPHNKKEKLVFLRYYTSCPSFITSRVFVQYDFLYDKKENCFYIAILKTNNCLSCIEIFKVKVNNTVADNALAFINNPMSKWPNSNKPIKVHEIKKFDVMGCDKIKISNGKLENSLEIKIKSSWHKKNLLFNVDLNSNSRRNTYKKIK